jgi:hypothetical protein
VEEPYLSPSDRPHRHKHLDQLTPKERQDVRAWLEEERVRGERAMDEFRRMMSAARPVVASTERTPRDWREDDCRRFRALQKDETETMLPTSYATNDRLFGWKEWLIAAVLCVTVLLAFEGWIHRGDVRCVAAEAVGSDGYPHGALGCWDTRTGERVKQ